MSLVEIERSEEEVKLTFRERKAPNASALLIGCTFSCREHATTEGCYFIPEESEERDAHAEVFSRMNLIVTLEN